MASKLTLTPPKVFINLCTKHTKHDFDGPSNKYLLRETLLMNRLWLLDNSIMVAAGQKAPAPYIPDIFSPT